MQATTESIDTGNPALAGALERVGDRWSLQVLDALAGGPRRFAELSALLPGIATNVLSQRLRHLESERLLVALPYSRRPLRFAYELTEHGRALAGAIRLLAHWGAEHAGSATDEALAATAHGVCGTPLVARWWCPTCDEPADSPTGEVVWL
jgi:DNA-binding HxlR family transcriptional regulator